MAKKTRKKTCNKVEVRIPVKWECNFYRDYNGKGVMCDEYFKLVPKGTVVVNTQPHPEAHKVRIAERGFYRVVTASRRYEDTVLLRTLGLAAEKVMWASGKNYVYISLEVDEDE